GGRRARPELLRTGTRASRHPDGRPPNCAQVTVVAFAAGAVQAAVPVRVRQLGRERGCTMGFLDKMKGTAKQALNPVGQSGERDKIMRISNTGVETSATVNAMREVGTQLGGGHQIEFDLTVHPAEGAEYQAHVSQSMHDATLQGVAEGAQIVVKVDPEDPQSLLVWGAAS